jgi:hypothetical protein
MATRKKTLTKDSELNKLKEEITSLQEQIEILKLDNSNSVEEARTQGQQEVWQTILNFCKERMRVHFENRQDDLARELREIVGAVEKNIT